MAPPRNTLIVSDVHLCGVMPGSGPWMPYRQRDFLFDDDLALLLDSAVQWSRTAGASLEIVFNGDMFDFDAPDIRTMAPGTLPNSLSHNEAGAASLIGAILDDHPAIVASIGRCLAAGCRVVFIPGNHDAQLAFAGVRRVISSRLITAAIAAGSLEPFASIASRIKFASWFYRTPDGFHIEHGHQYDPVCGLENMLPTIVNGVPQIEETIGSVASYHVPAILGCVNPYAIDPLDVRPKDLLASAIQCGKERPVPAQWYAVATVRFIRQVAAIGPSKVRPRTDSLRIATQKETGATDAALAQHAALFSPKKAFDHFAYTDGWKGYGVDTDRRLRAAAAKIADIHSPCGVVMGHTHRAYSVWMNGKFFGNTGSWAPRIGDAKAVSTMPGNLCDATPTCGASGSFVWISSCDGKSKVGTYSFKRQSDGAKARIMQIGGP